MTVSAGNVTPSSTFVLEGVTFRLSYSDDDRFEGVKDVIWRELAKSLGHAVIKHTGTGTFSGSENNSESHVCGVVWRGV
jgi:hypothetical protein